MKRKFVHLGGPFDGKIGKAHNGVTEFWKKDGEEEFRYTRVARRKFVCDRKRKLKPQHAK
jgi:hypothetical protein